MILGALLISQFAQRLSNALNRKIVAQNSSTTSPPAAGAPAPTITSVTLTSSNSVTINGTNLTGVTAVKFGSVVAASVNNAGAPNSIIATPQSGSSLNDGIEVDAAGGVVKFSSTGVAGSTAGLNAGADFTMPNLGQSGLNLMVSPSFSYSQVHPDDKWAFAASIWGNTFATDSVKAQAAAKFLSPESSSFGFKVEGVYAFTKGKDLSLGATVDLDALSKKIDYLDPTTKIASKYSPFVTQERLGLTMSAFNSAIVGSFYYNFFQVQAGNDNFSKFFSTNNKCSLAYPEFNISGIINLSQTSNQAINIGFDFISNNSDVKLVSSTTDNMIIYLKVGFVSRL